MKRTLGIFVMTGLLLVLTSGTNAQESEVSAPAPVMDEAMMAKWKEYSTPAEAHKVLEPMVGNWNYAMKWWMGPDAPPEETTGTQESRWIMDGRFIEQTVAGQSMGQPFSGRSIKGYDNAKKEYVSMWFDNMGTGIMMAKGSYDAAANTITESGSFECPLKGQMAFRWVTKFINNNEFVFESYTTENGQEFKSMEIKYTRK